ncbi:MAG TPA: hypothetical protein VIF82_04985 [Burkholderiaceae bacterium]|jgi:hypothetical protein
MSREHYVSDGIFDGESITAIGLSWCRHDPCTIPLKGAVAKILCAKHNSALSDFDNEAAKLSKFIMYDVYLQPSTESVIRLQGKLLEKWALKTFINLGYLRALHREQPNSIEPPDLLVQYIYCDGNIPEGIGLYHVSSNIEASNIEASNIEAGLSWNVIQCQDERNRIVGLNMMFYGVRFVVSIEPLRAEGKIEKMGVVDGFDFSTTQITYRPTDISFIGASTGRKRIELDW